VVQGDATMTDITSITAAILAGGLGTRLRSVVADKPKVLAEILSRPFLTYLLDQLIHWGVKKVVLCTGYMGDSVQSVIGTSYGALKVAYSQEPEPLGTGGALRLALPLLRSNSVLVLNGDSYCEANLQAMWDWHFSRRSEATLFLVNMADTRRYGRVQIDAQGHIVRFEEKDESSRPGLINAGIYLIKRHLLETMPDLGSISLERDMFPLWIGHGFHGYQGTGPFIDIGTPEAYAMAERFFAKATS
jgi:D-glycero-alpha-D-manno-heptose 1-phosphate guanylyltransferase